jgi:DNA-binding SARP family transcriptional activator
MLRNFLDEFRDRKSATSNKACDDLERTITHLREMVAIDRTREMTTAYLVELQAVVEAVGRAIKEERWAREGYSEFLGE